MSKGLNALENLENFVNETMGINHFKESGWHIQGTKEYLIIEKELTALDIIEFKQVNINMLFRVFEQNSKLDKYNDWQQTNCKLTKYEFNLLKEVFKK